MEKKMKRDETEALAFFCNKKNGFLIWSNERKKGKRSADSHSLMMIEMEPKKKIYLMSFNFITMCEFPIETNKFLLGTHWTDLPFHFV